MLRAMVALVLLALGALAGHAKEPDLSLAATFELPKIPGVSRQAADWRQFDAFFTFVVKRFGDDVPANLKESVVDAFLDSRYELTSAIAPGRGGDPVPQLFVNGWRKLSQIGKQALPALPKQTAGLYSGLLSAADKLALTGAAGLTLTPDALRGMARLLAPSSTADPLAYNTNVDSALRSLLGFGAPLTIPGTQSRLDRRFLSPEGGVSILSFLLVRPASAAEPARMSLNQLLPDPKNPQTYLKEVRSLLLNVAEKIAAKFKFGDQHSTLYRQIVFSAAWQESCWRQFIKKGTPLTSATGDLGLMQVNRHTWRGVYDLKGLGGDIEYNGAAGGEILLNYLTRSAIKKGEDKQRGGHLARATYSAYNGGPSAVGRYRGVRQRPEWKKVDEAFWDKFQRVSAGREMDVRECYEK